MDAALSDDSLRHREKEDSRLEAEAQHLHSSMTAQPEEGGGRDDEHDKHEDGSDIAVPQMLQSPPVEADGGGAADDHDTIIYLQGLRFWMVSLLIGVMLFLVQIETSIVTTSLVAITKDLGDFDMASWILSSYLLGFVGVVVMVAKLSDILGRKPLFVLCIIIFTVFSGGCASARSMAQLITLRAFQGMGGGGSYALSTIMIVEIVPPQKYSMLVAYTGIAIVLAMVLGPIVGGAISSNTTWRWIFLFNVPVGVVGLVLALAGIPSGFPHHGRPRAATTVVQFARKASHRIDFPGCVLLLTATMSFTAAFQEAGSQFAWDSPYFIVLLVASVVLWAVLLLWERRVTTQADNVREPVLPWRLLTNHVMVGILLSFVLLGGPLTLTSFQLPQRFQLVNGLSGLDAGVRLVPFGGSVPVGTIMSANLAGKLRLPIVYMVLAGALLQVVGFALLGTVASSAEIPPAVYGYQVIAGVGCGFSFQTLFLAIPFTVEKRDQAVGLGTASQFRAMGSAIIVAVATAVFNGYILSPLGALGISDPTNLTSQGQIPSALQADVRQILSEGYDRQMLVLCACGAAQALAAMLIWKQPQIRVA